MSDIAREELVSRVKGLSDEEREIVLSEIPFEVIWCHIMMRVSAINNKITGFINLVRMVPAYECKDLLNLKFPSKNEEGDDLL